MSDMKYKDNIVKFRRDLHRIPELDFDLPKTVKYLTEYLEKLPCEITKIGKASFVAFFDAGKEMTVGFRTDMDALAMDEKTGLDFSSEHPGQMHACGHDGHMSIMLAFASEIPGMLDRINKNVLLIFQAGEETTGGAFEICESGIFEKYKTEKIFGLHIWPGYPANMIVCRRGPFMAGTKVLWLDVEGKSSHIAKPEEGIDALDIGTQLVQDIYKMNRDEIPDGVSRILKFGEFHSGTGVNILSGETHIGGTTRFYDYSILEQIERRIHEISRDLEEKYMCKIEFNTSKGYPPVINPDILVDELESAVMEMKKTYDINYFHPEDPFLPAEDFAQYQKRLPGLFFFLGTGMDLSLHNGEYDINEDVLPTGVEVFKMLLLNS